MSSPVAPSVDPLHMARELILRPGGLDDRRIDKVFGEVLTHAVDFADLYFQLAHQESWSLEDGIVKDGSASIEQGVGVRALAGEKTGFAYSDEIVLPALEEASRAARAIAVAGGERRVSAWHTPTGHSLYLPADPSTALATADKVAWLERVDREARRLDPRIVHVNASLVAVHEVVLIATSDGELAADVRPLVRFNISVLVEQNGRREQGYAGAGGRYSLADLVAGDKPLELAREAVRQALVNLEAVPAPAGTMTVVLGAGWPGILLHEAIGHGLEGDFNRKGTSAFANRIGEKVAAVKSKIAELMGAAPTGNGRRESFAHATLPRMTNTYMRPGPHDPQEIIRSVARGIYAVNFGGGQVDITSGKFVFSASEAYAIENGRITAPLKGATLIGNGPDALTRVTMVGNDLKLDEGVGTCGKEGQSVPVGVGQPTLKIEGLTVGGTG